MKKYFFLRELFFFALLMVSLVACEKPAIEPLRPTAAQNHSAKSASTQITPEHAQHWINANLTAAHSYPLDWSRATITQAQQQELLLVPFQEAPKLFGGNDIQGYRYLVLNRTEENQLDGIIIEILVQQPKRSINQGILLARSAFEHLQNPSRSFPASFNGLVFYYTLTYQYFKGNSYLKGIPAKEDIRLGFKHGPVIQSAPNSGSGDAASVTAPTMYQYCTDWYSIETGRYITTTCQYSYEYVEPQPPAGGWGGTWGTPSSNTGGGSTGGTSTGTNFDPSSSSSYPLSSTASVTQENPTLANYGAVISTTYDGTSKVLLKIEIDTKNHDIKKLALGMTGLMGPTTFSQVGDGVMLRYDATTNRYYFSVTFQLNGTANTMYNGKFQTLSGWIDLDNNTARTRISVVP